MVCLSWCTWTCIKICTGAHTNTLTRLQIDLMPFANYLYISTILLSQLCFRQQQAIDFCWAWGGVYICQRVHCVLSGLQGHEGIHFMGNTRAGQASSPLWKRTVNLFRLMFLSSSVEIKAAASRDCFDSRKSWTERVANRVVQKCARQTQSYHFQLHFGSHPVHETVQSVIRCLLQGGNWA